MDHQRSFAQQQVSRRTLLQDITGLFLGGSLLSLTASCSSAPATASPSQTPTSHALGALLLTYRGHTGTVEAVAWSPDGKRIASGSSDTTAQVWDATTGKTSLTYSGHGDRVTSVAWSPDGKRIASASGDQTVQIWDASNGNRVSTYRGHALDVYTAKWSPDGQSLAS